MMVVFCVAHLLAAEYISAERTRGDVLLYHRGHGGKPSKQASDPEGAITSPIFAQDIDKEEGGDSHHERPRTVQNILKQSSVFHWDNLSYEVKTKHGTKKILNSIDGWVKPGTLTALMVGSLWVVVTRELQTDKSSIGRNRRWENNIARRARSSGKLRNSQRRGLHRRHATRCKLPAQNRLCSTG